MLSMKQNAFQKLSIFSDCSLRITDMSMNSTDSETSSLYMDNYNKKSSADDGIYVRGEIERLLYCNLQLTSAVSILRPCYTTDPNLAPTMKDLDIAIKGYQYNYKNRKSLMNHPDFNTAIAYTSELQKHEELLKRIGVMKVSIQHFVSKVGQLVKQDHENPDSPKQVTRDTRAYLLRRCLFAEFMLENFSHVKGFQCLQFLECSELFKVDSGPTFRTPGNRKRLHDPDDLDICPSHTKRSRQNLEIVTSELGPSSRSDTYNVRTSAGHWTDCDVTEVTWSDVDCGFADDEGASPLVSKPRRKLFRKSQRRLYDDISED